MQNTFETLKIHPQIAMIHSTVSFFVAPLAHSKRNDQDVLMSDPLKAKSIHRNENVAPPIIATQQNKIKQKTIDHHQRHHSIDFHSFRSFLNVRDLFLFCVERVNYYYYRANGFQPKKKNKKTKKE